MPDSEHAFSADVLMSLVRGRRSIRKFEARPIPREVVFRLLEAARWAPSAHNRQPWRFVVLSKTEEKRTLADQMAKQLAADLRADGLDADAIKRDTDRSRRRLSAAPVLILVCLSMADMDIYPDARRQQLEYTMAIQSAAMAAQNLLLAAHAEGLGACWICAPLFCQDTVREVLELPTDYDPQGVITLGYPAEQKTKDRRPLNESVIYR